MPWLDDSSVRLSTLTCKNLNKINVGVKFINDVRIQYEIQLCLCVHCSFTYEVAPVFVLMETEVLRSLRQLVGWTEGDGIFCPGGSTSNMFAMNLARYRLFPEVKSQGLWAVPRLTIFTSAEVRKSC